MNSVKTITTVKFTAFIIAITLLHFPVFGQGDISQLLTKLKNTQNDSVKVDVYNDIFNYYQYSNPDSAIYYIQEGLNLFTAKNFRYGIAALTESEGFEDAAQGRMELGRKRQTEALKIYEEINNQNGIASAHGGLGVIESRSGNFDAAVRHFMIALKIYESTSNTRGIINAYLKLGVVNEISNNLAKALEYYNKALSLTADTPITVNKVYLYNNIGIVYGKKGDLKTSLEYFQKALEYCNKPELSGVQMQSLLNIGIVYHEFGNDGKALQFYNKALQMAKEKKMPEDYARTMVNIATITSKTDPKSSIEQLKEALVIAKKLGQKSLLEDIYNGMVEDYKKTGDYKDALSLMEEQRDIEDSLYTVTSAKDIANMESVNELEQSNARIKELKLEEQRNLLKKDIIIVIAICLAIALIFISVYYRKTTRLNEKLSKRESELENSNNVKDKLFSIIGHDLRGPIGNIPMMLKILEDESTTGEERKFLLDSMAEHVHASMDTLDKLLYWGKSQIKGRGIKPETFNTAEYIENSIKLTKSSADLKHITVTNMVNPAITIYGDRAHFDFVIRNLLSNAIKFTHANGAVEISATNSEKQPGFTVFAVKDNGMGIAKEKLTNIFEPFNNSTAGTANEKGTSMGLILCKEFVIENGGKICVESEPGKGSTFYFTFKTA